MAQCRTTQHHPVSETVAQTVQIDLADAKTSGQSNTEGEGREHSDGSTIELQTDVEDGPSERTTTADTAVPPAAPPWRRSPPVPSLAPDIAAARTAVPRPTTAAASTATAPAVEVKLPVLQNTEGKQLRV